MIPPAFVVGAQVEHIHDKTWNGVILEVFANSIHVIWKNQDDIIFAQRYYTNDIPFIVIAPPLSKEERVLIRIKKIDLEWALKQKMKGRKHENEKKTTTIPNVQYNGEMLSGTPYYLTSQQRVSNISDIPF